MAIIGVKSTSSTVLSPSLTHLLHPFCYHYPYVNVKVNVFHRSKRSTRGCVILCNGTESIKDETPADLYVGICTGGARNSSLEYNGPLVQTSDVMTEGKQIRKYAPLLESPLLLKNNVSTLEVKTIPDIWRASAEKFGDQVALVDRHHDPPTNMTYKQLEQNILDFSEGLRVIGVKPYEKIALFADNSCRWTVADQGIMATGAVNIARGSRSSVEELLHIYNHSESAALIVDNPELYHRMADAFKSEVSVGFVILLWGEKSSIGSHMQDGIPSFSYKEIIDMGREHRAVLAGSQDAREKYVYEPIKPDDVAALIYTSGTTGNPKGVILTHRNLLHLVHHLYEFVPAGPKDRFFSMLPPWHAYERTNGYFILFYGVEVVYTNIQHLKDDLTRYRPHYLCSVPLVYQSLYSGIQKQISTSSAIRKLVALSFIRISMTYMQFKNIYEGKYLSRNPKQPSRIAAMLDWLSARAIVAILHPLHVLAKKVVYDKIHSSIGILKSGISGGGNLPLHIDRFFEAIGVKIQVGYGLTESSPVISARLPNYNVIGTVGHPIHNTEVKIVHDETGEELPPGSKGIVKARGPQTMQGYYKNPRATKQALDEDGWLNTGDIGWITPSHSVGRSRNAGGMIVLEGRAKDTIVLSTGENIEPEELEEAAMRSSLIQQIVVIGQDQRRLGAIIVPNKEEIMLASNKLSTSGLGTAELSKKEIAGLLSEELRNWTSDCSFQIGPILVIEEPFTIDNGLMTPTMKIRRNQVVELYKDQIYDLYK